MASRVLSINCLCKLTYQPQRFSNFKSQFGCCCKDATILSTQVEKFTGENRDCAVWERFRSGS